MEWVVGETDKAKKRIQESGETVEASVMTWC